MQFTPTQKRAFSWGAIAVLISSSLLLLGSPFVIAIVLACALTPVVDWLDAGGKRRVRRLLVIFAAALLFTVVVLEVTLLGCFALLVLGHFFGSLGILVALLVGVVLLAAVRRDQTQYLSSQLYLKGSH
jgi:predicted PurR-regulated permease PerM